MAGAEIELGGAVYHIKVDTNDLKFGLKSAEDEVHKFTRSVERSGRSGAMGLLFMSQAIEDVQYGFSAIVNNIPQIVMSFGGGAGIAGAVSIASVAINQLLKHWGDLTDAFNAAWSNTPADRLKHLREAAEGAAKAFEMLDQAHSKLQSKLLEVNKEAIVGPGVGAITRGLAQSLTAMPGMLSPEQQKFIEQHAWFAMSREQAAAKVSQEEAKRLLGQANDPNATEQDRQAARNRINFIAGRNPGAFPSGFQMMGPAEMAGQAEQERMVREHEEGRRRNTRDRIATAEEQAAKEKDLDNKARQMEEMGREQERGGRVQALQDEEERLQRVIRRMAARMSPEMAAQAEATAQGIHHRPRQSDVMSAKQYADRIMMAGFEAVPQKQLNELVVANRHLNSIKQRLKDLGKMK